MIERLFARQVARLRVNNLPVLDEDAPASVAGGDLKHGGTARQAFHLQHVLQPDAPQHAVKSLYRL